MLRRTAMARLLVLWLAAFLLPLGAAAELRAEAPIGESELAQPALWRIEGDAGDVTILGSIHLLKPGTRWLEGAVAEAAYAAETLTLEIHKTPETETRIQQLTVQHGVYRDGAQLDQAVPRELYAKARDIAAQLGLPEAHFRQFRPWAASLMIGVGTIMKLGFDPSLGVDETLSRRLSARGVPIRGLETAEQVIDALARHSPEIQLEMLRQSVRDFDQAEKLLDELTAAWARGDAPTLDRLLHNNVKSVPEFHHAVMIERNENWLPQIKRLIATPGKHLLVVGIGHLVGKDSIIAMLERDGYEIERIQ